LDFAGRITPGLSIQDTILTLAIAHEGLVRYTFAFDNRVPSSSLDVAIQKYLPTTAIAKNESKINQPTNQPPTTTMHFLTTAFKLLFLTTSLQVLASSLTFMDIERRWSAGESDVSISHDSSYHPTPKGAETSQTPSKQPSLTPPSPQASIHSHHNPRSASPAWPLAARDASPEPSTTFAESYDAVTQQKTGRFVAKRSKNSALEARIRDFATRLLRSKGESQMIAEKRGAGYDVEEEWAPVLRPMKVKYTFTA
jgi:hypothetical protein